jgi:hypothetical protein
MMIPESIVAFLERATLAVGGTRDRDLVPHVHRIAGWAVGADRRTIACLIARGFTDQLAPAIEDNGRFALTVCEVPSHETYQFKCGVLGSRPIEPADRIVFELFRDRLIDRLSAAFGFAPATLRAYLPQPALALALEVREIYLQTPGPGAGARVAAEQA